MTWRIDEAPDRRRDLFGGRGEVRVWSMLGSELPPFACVLGCELDPGGRVGAHVQEHFPEIVIVTEGIGVARVDGSSIHLRAGTVVPLPLGAVLEIDNESPTDPLRYLIVKASGGT